MYTDVKKRQRRARAEPGRPILTRLFWIKKGDSNARRTDSEMHVRVHFRNGIFGVKNTTMFY